MQNNIVIGLLRVRRNSSVLSFFLIHRIVCDLSRSASYEHGLSATTVVSGDEGNLVGGVAAGGP